MQRRRGSDSPPLSFCGSRSDGDTRSLVTEWRLGAFCGPAAEEAFSGSSGHTGMTQIDIHYGCVICEIAIAPVTPAEFVIFRSQQIPESRARREMFFGAPDSRTVDYSLERGTITRNSSSSRRTRVLCARKAVRSSSP